ncbi:NodT family efflux transporter outer membrane factor (OMF) lipoprotein [Breznakibacter xylanolyticus]|uniref:NodT family efflux transporter outer membrane factor (OMF) lipoprotein n=2 Tax=Breznakibacter xylanolyticus TaxID=990 RepID=A0A2W7NIT3_9BACT|nr:NodT family efflux transporter outer membrane factor (OMF) lipoprotein [Breznakibacter xylanolyticus]
MTMRHHHIRKSLLALTLTGAALLTSCKSHQPMAEAGTDVSRLYRQADTLVTDTTTIADTPWQTYFADANLKALLTEGIEKNLNLQIAQTRIQQAEASLSMARGANLPTLALAAQGSHTRLSNGADGTKVLGYNYSTNFQLGFVASWEMNLWGKLSSQTKARYASFLSSYEYRNLIQTNVIAGIAKAYYALMALDEQLRITTETVELLRQSAETMQALKDAGQTTGAAVEQSKALLYNTQLSIATLQSQIRQQENAICVLLGRAPGAIERSSIIAQTDAPQLNHGVPAQMMALRPDVKQAELSFRAACELTNVAQASLYPTFTLSTASLGFASGELADFFKPANIAANIAAGISQPLLYKRQLKGNLMIAKAQQQEALLTFQSTVLTAGQEISDILYGYQASLSKNELRNRQIASLTTAVDFTQELLRAGEATYTEVLNAQQSLLQAQLSRVNDRLEQLNFSVSLYKALGGGVR